MTADETEVLKAEISKAVKQVQEEGERGCPSVKAGELRVPPILTMAPTSCRPQHPHPLCLRLLWGQVSGCQQPGSARADPHGAGTGHVPDRCGLLPAVWARQHVAGRTGAASWRTGLPSSGRDRRPACSGRDTPHSPRMSTTCRVSRHPSSCLFKDGWSRSLERINLIIF